MSGRLSLSEISEIAQEVTRDYNPRELPSLDDIAWAFPVEGQDGCHIYDNRGMKRIPNTQETHAWYQLGVFSGINNAIRLLVDGAPIPRRAEEIPYNHLLAQKRDHGDMSHQHWRYFRVLPEEIKKRENLERFTKPKSYFWDNIPQELTKEVLLAYQILRSEGAPMDEWGFWDPELKDPKISHFADNSELTRKYITHLKHASELGGEYLLDVVKNRYQAPRYPQLVLDTAVETWGEETEFQLGFFKKGDSRFLFGKGVKEYDGTSITLVYHLPKWADRQYGSDETWSFVQEVATLKKFKNSLWKVVPPTEE